MGGGGRLGTHARVQGSPAPIRTRHNPLVQQAHVARVNNARSAVGKERQPFPVSALTPQARKNPIGPHKHSITWWGVVVPAHGRTPANPPMQLPGTQPHHMPKKPSTTGIERSVWWRGAGHGGTSGCHQRQVAQWASSPLHVACTHWQSVACTQIQEGDCTTLMPSAARLP